MAVIGVNTAEVEIFFILYSTMHKVATTNTYKQYIHTYIYTLSVLLQWWLLFLSQDIYAYLKRNTYIY